MSQSVLVVGCGIFGITAALELSRRGHQVSVMDPGPLPHPRASSTDISKVIRTDYVDDFYMDLMEAAFPGWDAWNILWPRPLYHQTGMVFLASQPLAPGGFEYESLALLNRRGHPVERLDSEAIRRQFPAWNAGRYVDGYFNPRAGWAESGAVVAQLIEDARASGVTIHEGMAFGELIERNQRVEGIQASDGTRLLAETVILAAGAWTPALLPDLARVMWPVGQPVFHFAPPDYPVFQPPQFPAWAADIHTAGWYGFPANQAGLVKVANHGPGRRLDPRVERTVPQEEEGRFRRFLSQSLPGLQNAPVAGTRVCFYCDTFDGNFWIDYDPGREGLLVCAGGSGHGFKFAPILGSITADVLERKANPYAGRFSWREPGAGVQPPPEEVGSAAPRK